MTSGKCRAEYNAGEGGTIEKPDGGLPRARIEKHVVGFCIDIEVGPPYQSPPGRKCRAECAADEGGVIEKPNCSLACACIEKEVIRFSIAIHIGRASHRPPGRQRGPEGGT